MLPERIKTVEAWETLLLRSWEKLEFYSQVRVFYVQVYVIFLKGAFLSLIFSSLRHKVNPFVYVCISPCDW